MTCKVLVLNNYDYGQPFNALGFEVSYITNPNVDQLLDAHLVCFTGGTDVDTRLYGEAKNSYAGDPDVRRDTREAKIFETCVEAHIPMVGICRGFQFLNVMNGGKLVQHCNGHAGPNHTVIDLDDGIFGGHEFVVNSLHHQMVILPENKRLGIPILVTPSVVSSYYIGEGGVELSIPQEVEAAVFPRTRSAGVQYHPEMMAQTSAAAKFFQGIVRGLLK